MDRAVEERNPEGEGDRGRHHELFLVSAPPYSRSAEMIARSCPMSIGLVRW